MNTMTNETKHYRRYTIALVLLTIVEMIAFHFAMSIEGILMLFPLNLAFIILWIYAFVIVFRCFRMRNKWQRCIMIWIIILLLYMPIFWAIRKMAYSSVKYDLPNGITMTVEPDKITFDENGKKSSIELSNACENYSLTLVEGDTLYFFTSDSVSIQTHELRYPIKIYTGNNKEEYEKTTIDTKLKWGYCYSFVNDSPFIYGVQTLEIRKGDSIYSQWWMNNAGYLNCREEGDKSVRSIYK